MDNCSPGMDFAQALLESQDADIGLARMKGKHVTDNNIVRVNIKSRIVTVEGPRGMHNLQSQKPQGQ